jgi:hypothetical protein
LKVQPHIGERILDHRTGTVSAVQEIYDRFTYVDEMRAAIMAWEKKVSALSLKEKWKGDSMGNSTILSPDRQVA